MKYENAGPRMAVTPDGKILFFDEEGTIIDKPKQMKEKEFTNLIENNEPRSKQKMTIYTFGPSSDCRIVYETKYGTFCFWVVCETGQFLRLC
jgi:hypothetical protein